MDSNPSDNSAYQAEQDRLIKLAAFAHALVSKRKEAVDARRQSGIEQIWQEDEEYYNGIDECNRGEVMLKPATKEGRVTSNRFANDNRSTAFVNITQPYVDLITAREFDMLFPVDDRPFSIEPTPIPEINGVVDSQNPMPNGDMTEGDAAKAYIKDAEDKAEKAETQIWDWLSESSWGTQGHKVVAQKNMLGTGVLKGPYPVKYRKRKMMSSEFGITVQMLEQIKPASKMIDVWNLFPDPACGDDIHSGAYIWEKDTVTGKQLRELKGTSGFLDDEIDKVLHEGPNCKYIEDSNYRQRLNSYQMEQDNYDIWYYHGVADKNDLSAAGLAVDEDLSVVVVMVNSHVIKASQSVLDSGEFPYDIFVYQKRIGHWAGIGVARQVRTAQRMVNAASRNLMDNAGVSAGPQIIYRKGVVRPANQIFEITPLKLWEVDDDADLRDVQSAFTSISIPTMQQELEAIIRLALEFAERATSMPLILQGQQGSATNTVGGMQILQQNSNTVLRRTAKLFDDVIERHIGRYYEWLLLHSDNDDIKGDFSIIAKGSSALYERDAQNQMIMQLLQFSANPVFGLNPEQLMIEVLKSNKISPDRVCFTDQEKEQMQQQAPPPDPAIQVAQIRGQAQMEVEQLKQKSDSDEIAMKQKAMEAELALKLQMAQQDRDHEMQIKQLDYQIKLMELSQSSEQSLASIKAALADTTMRLGVQKELSYASMDDQKQQSERDKQHEAVQGERDKSHEMAKIAMQPPSEPVGRAPKGQAYER